MFGIVFTTPEEAYHVLREAVDTQVEGLTEDTPVQMNDLVFAVTGNGKIKAALATERLLRAYELDGLLHVGTCTALGDAPDVGTLVGASFVLEGDRVELDAPTYPRMPLECPYEVPFEGTLVSQDHATEGEERSYWERIADVRDETGYAVAYVAAQHGVPCYVTKAVSADSDDEEKSSDSHGETVLAPFLQRVLNERRQSTTS